MIAEIGNKLELTFWQLAAQAMSKARPLSTRILRAAKFSEGKPQPLLRAIRPEWIIAVGGWLLGLVLGYWFAVR